MPKAKKSMMKKMVAKSQKRHATQGAKVKSRVAGKSTKYCKAGV